MEYFLDINISQYNKFSKQILLLEKETDFISELCYFLMIKADKIFHM